MPVSSLSVLLPYGALMKLTESHTHTDVKAEGEWLFGKKKGTRGNGRGTGKGNRG